MAHVYVVKKVFIEGYKESRDACRTTIKKPIVEIYKIFSKKKRAEKALDDAVAEMHCEFMRDLTGYIFEPEIVEFTTEKHGFRAVIATPEIFDDHSNENIRTVEYRAYYRRYVVD